MEEEKNRRRFFDAIRRTDNELVRSIVAKGIDCNRAGGDFNRRPLFLATLSFSSNLDLIKILISCGANPHLKDGDDYSILMSGILGENKEIFNYFLDFNLDLEAENLFGDTALIYAVNLYSFEFIQILLNRGADVNHSNKKNGITALINASFDGEYRIAMLLLDYKADPNIADHYGYTALRDAVHEGHFEVVKLLIARGANINWRDKKGLSILDWAIKKNRAKIAEYLKSKGAK